ncbi:MAG TPA: fasciclin [Nocardioides bacterium]|nr:fasciclin [Nocardioides sp.]
MMKNLVTRLAALTAGALVATGVGIGVPADAATQHDRAGTKSLAKVLAADGTKLDRNWEDFDILEQAVLAVLAAKPTSPVALLTDGSVRLTAFLPTDQAFRDLVGDLTGKRPGTEKKVVNKLLKLADVNTIEAVLLYHVVAGKTLTSPKVIKAAKKGTKLTTAQGGTVKVKDRKGNITLVDKDPDFANAVVILNGIDINRGNKQVGHAIDRVLLPIDL